MHSVQSRLILISLLRPHQSRRRAEEPLMPHPFAGRNVSSMPGGIPPLSRRTLLRGLAGAAGLAAAVPVLAACGNGSGSSSATDTHTVSFGSNGSDPVPKKAYAATLAAFTKASGDQVKVNTVD